MCTSCRRQRLANKAMSPLEERLHLNVFAVTLIPFLTALLLLHMLLSSCCTKSVRLCEVKSTIKHTGPSCIVYGQAIKYNFMYFQGRRDFALASLFLESSALLAYHPLFGSKLRLTCNCSIQKGLVLGQQVSSNFNIHPQVIQAPLVLCMQIEDNSIASAS